MRSELVENMSDFFKDAKLFASEAFENLIQLRDKAIKLEADTEMPTMTRINLMKLIADINVRIWDKLVPSQAIVEQVGDRKIEVSWATDDPNRPLCTKCGSKHYPNEECVVNIADRNTV